MGPSCYLPNKKEPQTFLFEVGYEMNRMNEEGWAFGGAVLC